MHTLQFIRDTRLVNGLHLPGMLFWLILSNIFTYFYTELTLRTFHEKLTYLPSMLEGDMINTEEKSWYIF